MQDRQALRLGCVKYLNARPLIHGWPGEVVLDHPSALCAQLARGELDVALVSSFEFLRNPIYKIVDNISIASDGPVYSVVVAHRGKISEVKEIELDPAAETSGNLLRCLLAELAVEARVLTRTEKMRLGTAATTPKTARLLIGDQAIRFRQERADEFEFWDLGEQWKKLTGLPFVYALWLVRPEIVDPKSVADRLRALRDQNLAKLDDLIATQNEFDSAFCHGYYRENLRFSFGEREKEGLRKFSELCQKHELLPKREIAFSLV
ncbi:MAG TPA: menaquinone biosynthesis protein [Chthoniobacterales bacterium]|nr:menaquinone biosynthesis protein [Chthoniobacterales bacterium]